MFSSGNFGSCHPAIFTWWQQDPPVRNIPRPKQWGTVISRWPTRLFPKQLKSSSISILVFGGSKIQGGDYSSQEASWTTWHSLTLIIASFLAGVTKSQPEFGGVHKLAVWHRCFATQTVRTRSPTQQGISRDWGVMVDKWILG